MRTRKSTRGIVFSALIALLGTDAALAQQGWQQVVSWGGDSQTRHPAAGVNAQGRVVVAFAAPPTPSSALAVFAARRPDPAAPWIDPVQVSAGATAAQFPRAAMSAAGDAVVVWQQIDGGQSRVRLAEFLNGAAAWTAPLDLSPDGTDATVPRLVVCGDVATVVWLAGGVVQSRRRQGANAFGPVSPLDATGGAVAPVEVAVSPACEVTTAWRRQLTQPEMVTAVARADTGAWSPVAPVSVPGEDPSGPALSSGPDDRITVAWQSLSGGVDAVRAARRSGSVWSGVTLALTSGRVSGIALTTDRTGVVTAAWGVRALNTGQNVIAFSRFDPAAGGWSAPAVVRAMTTDNIPRTLSAVADRTGTVTLAYGYSLNFDLPVLTTVRFDPFTRTWRAAGGFSGDSPVLSGTVNDGALLTWVQYPQPGASTFIATADFDATPRAPSIATATPADRVVTVTLTPPVSEPGFEPVSYHCSIDSGTTWTPCAPESPAAIFTIGGLTNGVSYPLAVRGVNRFGAGAPSAVVTATPVDVPLAPSNFRVAARTATTVTLEWRGESGTTPDGFVVEGGVQPGQTLVSLAVAASTRTLVVPLGPGVYHARVHAVRGGVRSAPSNELTLAAGLAVAPAAPRHLLGLTSGSAVALSWAPALEGGPVEAIRLDVTGSLAASVLLPPGETFSAAGVPAGTYRATVSALNAAGSSAPSNPVLLFVPEACIEPNPPEDLRVTATGRTIRVTWAPPSAGAAVSRYDLVVQGSLVGTFPMFAREVTAEASGTFTIRVIAVNACGTSPATAPLTIAVP